MFKSIKKQRLEEEPETSKEDKPETSKDDKSEISKEDSPVIEEDETDDNEILRRKAIDRLKHEAARGAERSKTMGVQGWFVNL